MYTQQSQTEFDPALLSLLAVAKKVTPSGQPTIAAQIAEEAQQLESPQTTPQEMPPAPQGIAGALQQAQQTAPSVAQNMQAQGMPPQMPPQAPEGMPPPEETGIAALPLPAPQYAEGGVIGYAGPDGSLVGDEDETTSIAGDWTRGLLADTGDLARDLLSGLSDKVEKEKLANRLRSSMATLQPGLLEQMRGGTKDFRSERESRESQASQMEAMLAALRGATSAPRPEGSWAAEEKPTTTPQFEMQEGTTPQSLIAALAYELNSPDTSPAARVAINKKIQELTAQIPSRAPDRVSDVGILAPRMEAPIASSGGRPDIESLLSSSGRPTVEAAKALAASLVPAADQTEAKRLYKLRQELEAGRPDFEGQKAQAFAEAYEKDKSGRKIDRLIELAQATAQGGIRGVAPALQQFDKSKMAIDLNFKQGQIALEEAKQAKAEGSLEKLMAANQKIADAAAKHDELVANAGMRGYGDLTSQFVAELNARERGLDRTAQERIAQLGGTEGALLKYSQEHPEEFAAYMALKAGLKPGGTRAAQIDRYADDYNKLTLDMMANTRLENQGIYNLQDYIKYRDAIAAGGVGATADKAPPVGAVIQGYKFKGGNPADKSNWEKV